MTTCHRGDQSSARPPTSSTSPKTRADIHEAPGNSSSNAATAGQSVGAVPLRAPPRPCWSQGAQVRPPRRIRFGERPSLRPGPCPRAARLLPAKDCACSTWGAWWMMNTSCLSTGSTITSSPDAAVLRTKTVQAVIDRAPCGVILYLMPHQHRRLCHVTASFLLGAFYLQPISLKSRYSRMRKRQEGISGLVGTRERCGSRVQQPHSVPPTCQSGALPVRRQAPVSGDAVHEPQPALRDSGVVA